MKARLGAALSLLALSLVAAARADVAPASFESTGDDRRAIQGVLDDYTRAVSTQDRPLFESLLLNPSIPFSNADVAIRAGGAPHGTENFGGFLKNVFTGQRFNQQFKDVHVQQDGSLAAVTLVFVNTAPDGTSWGWGFKTLQLLKVAGRWRIASELYTGHPG